MPRKLILALVVTLLVCSGALAYMVATHPWFDRDPDEQVVSLEDIGGDFTLTAHSGQTVTSFDFRGKFLLVFFGYTFCPDICPGTLQTVSLALDKLSDEEAAQIQPLFITADPARDTPEALAEYVGHFHPSVIGLTGSEEELKALAGKYRAGFSRVPVAEGADPAHYLVNHTTFLYLMDRDGRFRQLFPHSVTVDDLAAALKAAL